MIVNLSQDDIALALGRQMLARLAADKRIAALEAQLAEARLASTPASRACTKEVAS